MRLADRSVKEDMQKQYPQMMSSSRVLLLNFDLLRFHSFELFAQLLLEEDYFFSMNDPAFLTTFVNQPTLMDQVYYYYQHAIHLNPLAYFDRTKDATLDDMENLLNERFKTLNRTIPTDLLDKIGIVFQNDTVDGYLLSYQADPVVATYHKNLKKCYTTDRVLDLRMAVEIIRLHQINVVMLSSFQTMLRLIAYLEKYKIPLPIAYFVGKYFYNYEPETGIVRYVDALNRIEYNRRIEINVVDPFTAIHNLKQKEKQDE